MIKQSIVTILCIVLPSWVFADVIFKKGQTLPVSISPKEAQVVHTALEIFSRDFSAVFDAKLAQTEKAQILIATVGMNSPVEKLVDSKSLSTLKAHAEGYIIQVKNDKMYILGSDKRGTAYGILELSRKIGVSPWVWWADSYIQKKTSCVFNNNFMLLEYPSVKLRGIFINDEDWGINPWSYQTFEPSKIKGQIGPKTHAQIFELLLRLRANTYWPAMHSVSVAFYQTPGNKEIADKYGIVVGASHCEPMMRNANYEWKIDGVGNYDYVHNRVEVLKFWETRVKELKNSDNLYTLGIRGVHDGKMQGANTLQEQKDALTHIIADQRKMIETYLNKDVTQIPQVFVPYKEVLDVYNMGLAVPEDVTLLWCDDNYGYIRHLPTEQERARKGGNGVYYHVSYWGRPHDYLWLATNHPAQLYTQMKRAYDAGAQDIWILNVGDIKPGEYLTELFLDMAWDIDAIADTKEGLQTHLANWLSREFGSEKSADIQGVINEYYRLAYIRKPEFMGNTRTEEKDPKYNVISDLPWTEQEIRTRLAAYATIEKKVQELAPSIPAEKQSTWFELVEYPVLASAEMNKKALYGQLARHNLATWEKSDAAFDAVESLTKKYNALSNGKWNRMMDSKPRNLSVFLKVPHTTASNPLPASKMALVLNGNQFIKYEGQKPKEHGLGYLNGAISISKNSQADYQFKGNGTDSLVLQIAMVPNHPVVGKQIRYEIFLNGKSIQKVDFHTVNRDEQWKNNVLSNQSIKTIKLSQGIQKNDMNVISIKALDEGVMLDQLKFYH
ncbi:glycosyl hydrolase 115 family protein [Pedobacter sp. MW01-1-1]|uniref:glycosyl hydrolase 115 family protein n=1 Tax=Pedobacter sp. MW01-1-1 TaxID=3383027 RepID=UPI003FEE7856